MKDRFYWADLMRSFAIYLVVLNHNFLFQTNNLGTTIFSIILFTIIKTAIPLFIMLSGALLLNKKEPKSHFFKKRISKVIIPWIIWTFLYMFFNISFFHHSIDSFKEFKAEFFTTLLSQLWFLPLIVGIYLLTPIWRTMVQHSTRANLIYFLILWFLFTSIMPLVYPSLIFPINPGPYFAQALFYSGYFVLGYVLTNIVKRTISLPLLMSIFLLGFVWTIYNYYKYSNAEVTFNYLGPNIYLCTISIFMIIYQLKKNMKKSYAFVYKLIEKISIASLSIYIIHQPLSQILDPFLSPTFSLVMKSNTLLEGILKGSFYFVISFMLVFLLQKIPKTKFLFP